MRIALNIFIFAPFQNSQDPGGFGIMRYHCSDYETVRIGIKMIESILKNAGGYIMGTATSKNVSNHRPKSD